MSSPSFAYMARLLALSLLAALAEGQFGGAGYEPPPPICPAFSCPAGQKSVRNPDHQIWSYGCKDSGLNFLSPSSNPYGGQTNQKSVNKCCIERDICKQTCGMTSKACHELFQKCSKKICKGDQNCNMQAVMSEIMSEPYDPSETFDKDKKYDPDESKCKGYKRGQSESCTCVPKDDFKSATESSLKSFYGKFNSEKLNTKGEIKDVEEVWKKWKGKEPDMFLALATKYREKAVEIREKPKPPPYKPPPKAESFGDDSAEDLDYAAKDSFAADPEPPRADPEPPAAEEADPAETVFKERRRALETRKRDAKEAEDYDAADEAKQELDEVVKGEMERLNGLKKQAVEDEDFIAAKKLKARLAKLSEL